MSSFSQASLDVTANIFDNQLNTTVKTHGASKSNLTITYGIRHSFFRQPTDASGTGGSSRLVNFDPDFYDPSQAPCITSTGNMDVSLVNGVPTASTCNPNYNPLKRTYFRRSTDFQRHVGMKSPLVARSPKNSTRQLRLGLASPGIRSATERPPSGPATACSSIMVLSLAIRN